MERRKFLQITAGSLLAAGVVGQVNAQVSEKRSNDKITPVSTEGAISTFGVIADPQYAPFVTNSSRTRYYSNSLYKLSNALEHLDQEQLSFVITLGDIIDREWQSFDHIMPIYDKSSHQHYFVLGNHDYDVSPEYLSSITRMAGLQKTYYDYKKDGIRFIVLDGNDVSVFAPPIGDHRRELAKERLEKLKLAKAINAQAWNGSLSDEQFDWLKNVLDRAKIDNEPVIINCHYPVYPMNEHNLWDSERIVDLITTYPNVLAYFCGHNHAGNYGQKKHVHFVNFKGMVDTPNDSPYSIVQIFKDKIKINGFSTEENRELAIQI